MGIGVFFALAGLALLIAFVIFAFRQGLKVKPNRDRGGPTMPGSLHG
jgi:hypothetical protein